MDEFEKAANRVEMPIARELPGTGDFLVTNETGLTISIVNTGSLKSTYSQLLDGNENMVNITKGSFVELNIEGTL
jgi:hypothetical protein